MYKNASQLKALELSEPIISASYYQVFPGTSLYFTGNRFLQSTVNFVSIQTHVHYTALA